MKRWMAFGVTALALTVVAAACGGKDEQDAYVVQAKAYDFAYDMPDEIKSGLVTFEVSNDGVEYHEFGLAKIEAGKTMEDLQAAMGSEEPPSWATDIGATPILDPGKSEKLTRRLEPGTYVYVCYMPSSDGVPHAMKGMMKLFTVTGEADAEAPAADAVITATDDGFQVPAIKAGTETLELKNTGSDAHEFTIVAFDEGTTMDDTIAWFEQGLQGDAPAQFVGGMQIVQPGESVWVTLQLEPGTTYTVVDSDTGMTAEFTPEA